MRRRAFSFGESGDREQCAQAWVAHGIQTAETAADNYAILTGKRNDIGYRRDGYRFQKGIEQRLLACGCQGRTRQQRLHQFERDARAAELLVRILTAGPVRIEHGQCGRQLRFGQMMVGDDDINAEIVEHGAPLHSHEFPYRH